MRLSSLVYCSLLQTAASAFAPPIVSVRNGTYYGNYIESFHQDSFLGIPYAQEPTGPLRFMPPESLNETFQTPRNATEYGDVCIGLGLFGDNTGLTASEDCLTLNVVRPHGEFCDLPVAIWIHGGGFQDGSSRRDVYNLSYIVENGVETGHPFIGVSINYRLAAFGFLQSLEAAGAGATNVGLRDQLKAIEWVHENIAAFGGNPNHIVIWGESAGSISVAHLLGSTQLGDYVVGGIMESGSTQTQRSVVSGDAEGQEAFNNLTEALNCGYDQASNPLECLQSVDISDLTAAIKNTSIVESGLLTTPYIDGDFIKNSPTLRLAKGDFAKVPVIIGANSDEGTSFATTTVASDDDIKVALQAAYPLLTNSSLDKILQLYPLDDLRYECPYDSHLNHTLPASYGSQFPRYASIYGDISFVGPRRNTATKFAGAGVPVYSYRWNVGDKGTPAYDGASHFQEVVYVFDNPSTKFVTAAPWNTDQSSEALAELISKQWVSFITTLDPNNHGLKGVPRWPRYSTGNPQNFVFELDGDSYVEPDNFREEAIEFVAETIYNELQR